MVSTASREQPGRYQRPSGGLLGAVLVLVLVVVGFVGFRALFRGNQDQPVPTVEYAAAVTQARQDGRLAAPAPTSLPSGWRATSVRFQDGRRPTWHLGLLTAADTYVGIEESTSPAGRLATRFLGGDAAQGDPRKLAGRTWQTWQAGKAYGLTTSVGATRVFIGGRAGERAVVGVVGVLGFGAAAGDSPGTR